MSLMGRFLVGLLALLWLALSAAGAEWSGEEAGGPAVDVYLFWSASCPHCLAARPQIQALVAAHGARYEAMAAELGEEALAVPALFYCGRMEVGWDAGGEGGGSAGRLLEALEACRGGQRPPAAAPALHLPGLGEVDAARLSLPILTLLVAGMDAFNPCAFFVLLFLLSLLVHQRDRRRMLLIGMLFVGISGLMYFAFMAAWLGLSLSIPECGKADIFQRARVILRADSLPAMLAATVFLGIAANFYELLCTAGFPMVYTRLLKLLSGLMMLGLGLCLVLAPQALGDPRVAPGLLAVALGLTGLVARRGH